MPTPHEALRRAIAQWEGGFQAQPQDPGNYVTMPDGSRRLVGTMRGVTPAVLAAHRGVAVAGLTKGVMQSVTLEEAAEIGLTRFYRGTGLDLLPWGPATEALVDFAWGSGPGQAARSLQRMLGVVVDGVIGPITIDTYARWVAERGWEATTRAVRDMRVAFYDLIIRRNTALGVYRQGWRNRANWMTPESAAWWAPWTAEPAPLPVVADRYAGVLPQPTEPAPIAPPVAKEGAGGNQVLATLTAGAGIATPIVAPLLNADWKVVAIVLGAVVVVGLTALLIWREQQRKGAAGVGL